MFSLVLVFVCLFVSRIMQKRLNRFSKNSVERWHRAKEEIDFGGDLALDLYSRVF